MKLLFILMPLAVTFSCFKAQALAVREGKILAVSSLNKIKKYVGSQTIPCS